MRSVSWTSPSSDGPSGYAAPFSVIIIGVPG